MKAALCIAAITLLNAPAVRAEEHDALASIQSLIGLKHSQDTLKTSLSELGWEYQGGAVLGIEEWRHSPTRTATWARQSKSILILSSVLDVDVSGAAGFNVWSLIDMAHLSDPGENSWVMTNCKTSMLGEWVPGLIAVVRADDVAIDTGESALLGPALASWHVERRTGRFLRETLPVYCDDEGYGA